MKLVGTIEETYARAQAEGIGVSKNFIRQSAKSGRLPCVMAGNKYLIHWDAFMDFLRSPQPVPEREEATAYGIRKVKV